MLPKKSSKQASASDGILVPPIYATDLPILFVGIQGYKDTKNVLYSSFFSQIFLYLHSYQPINDWQGILIFTKASLDPGVPKQYREFANSQRFQRIYLDRLSDRQAESSIGLSLLQLIGVQPTIAPQKARNLIDRVQKQQTQISEPKKILELIETIFVYKFPKLSRQEIEEMLGLSELKQTKVYQEALQEGLEQGKLAAVPLLLKTGMSVEQIAQKLGLDVNTVREVAASK